MNFVMFVPAPQLVRETENHEQLRLKVAGDLLSQILKPGVWKIHRIEDVADRWRLDIEYYPDTAVDDH